MNTLTPRSDLYEYFGILWRGRKVILLGTAGCMILMAALTWAMPRLYVVRSEIDAGLLAQAQPVETNLLVEAVDRSQFTVQGGLFPESMPKGLTVSWHPPSTMILEAKSADPADALRRLQVLTAAVDAELDARFRRYALWRANTQEREVTAPRGANARLLRLTQLMDERTAAATTSAAEAHAGSVKAAAERASFQLASEARYRPPLQQLRNLLMTKSNADTASVTSVNTVLEALAPNEDDAEPQSIASAFEREDMREDALKKLSTLPELEQPVQAELLRILRQLAAYDVRVARGAELQRAAELLRKRDERGLLMLANTPPIADPAGATSLEKSLGELEKDYKDDPPMARAVDGTRAMFADLVSVYRDAQRVSELPGLARTPKVLVLPAMPRSPAWPRPVVNLAIAFLFGLLGSITFAVFASRFRSPDVS